MTFQRTQTSLLGDRILEPPRSITIVAGPRQVGKTTLVHSALAKLSPDRRRYLAVDQPADQELIRLNEAEALIDDAFRPRDGAWLVAQWKLAREAAQKTKEGFVLVFDEIQKIPRWSDAVKGLWDEDRTTGLNMHVVLLGSSPLLMQRGLTESLAGRFELIGVTHWSYGEMAAAFEFDLDDYLFFGGYPGAATLVRNEPRWRDYVRAALVEPNIERDILMMTRVDKPALLKQLFQLGCVYSGQILSFTKMLGQLQDAGNTVTLADYLHLLSNAGLLTGLQKYAGRQHRRRASPPKLNVLNTGLMSVATGYTKQEAKADRSYWGRLVESAVGAHLCNTSTPDCRIYYWRESPHEVDFILEGGGNLVAIEVKSAAKPSVNPGLDAFASAFGPCRKLLIGEGGISLAEFLSYPAKHWLS